jgi:hypothetical protein
MRTSLPLARRFATALHSDDPSGATAELFENHTSADCFDSVSTSYSDCSRLGPFGDGPTQATFNLIFLTSAECWQVFCIAQLHQIGFDSVELGLDMNSAKTLLVALLMSVGVDASHAAIRIADDRGGRIGNYLDRYEALRTSGETVVIDGLCLSACTIVLGSVSHDRICVTSHANLGFHAAYDFGANGRAVTNREATRMLYSHYPSQVRRWIAARGGLKSQMIFLRGKELMSMYRPCYLDAQASSPH